MNPALTRVKYRSDGGFWVVLEVAPVVKIAAVSFQLGREAPQLSGYRAQFVSPLPYMGLLRGSGGGGRVGLPEEVGMPFVDSGSSAVLARDARRTQNRVGDGGLGIHGHSIGINALSREPVAPPSRVWGEGSNLG